MKMKDKTFEEIFPSLKGKGREVENLAKLWGIEFRYKDTGEFVKTKVDVFDSITISENCIDKQKVRDVLRTLSDVAGSRDSDNFVNTQRTLRAVKKLIEEELEL